MYWLGVVFNFEKKKDLDHQVYSLRASYSCTTIIWYKYYLNTPFLSSRNNSLKTQTRK